MELDQNILTAFSGLISDSFTLLAGFVAIGIPLSLQIAEKYSEKHGNNYLVLHLLDSKYTNPRQITIAAIMYVFLAFSLKVIDSTNVDFILFNTYWFKYIIPSLLIILLVWFVLLFTSVCTFYLWLYKKLTTPAIDTIHELCEIPNKRR
jgi:hypothetical protein